MIINDYATRLVAVRKVQKIIREMIYNCNLQFSCNGEDRNSKCITYAGKYWLIGNSRVARWQLQLNKKNPNLWIQISYTILAAILTLKVNDIIRSYIFICPNFHFSSQLHRRTEMSGRSGMKSKFIKYLQTYSILYDENTAHIKQQLIKLNK